MKSQILATANITPVKMMLDMSKMCWKDFGGGAVTERQKIYIAGKLPDFLSSKVLPGEVLKLGKEGK
jgi:hypothetical protein